MNEKCKLCCKNSKHENDDYCECCEAQIQALIKEVEREYEMEDKPLDA